MNDARARERERELRDEARTPGGGEAPIAAPVPPTRTRLLYESRDGKFCLFEDTNGHLSAVSSAKLA